MSKTYSVGGYVKLAKLWNRSRESIIAYLQSYYQEKYTECDDAQLFDVYIDITGDKRIIKRPGMLRLMRDCAEGKVNLVATQTKAYLAANAREFCYLLYFLFHLNHKVDIVTEDRDYNINTIEDEEDQRAALEKMIEDYISLNPEDHELWLSEIINAIADLKEDDENG